MAGDNKFSVVLQKDTVVSKHGDSLNINVLNDFITFVFEAKSIG